MKKNAVKIISAVLASLVCFGALTALLRGRSETQTPTPGLRKRKRRVCLKVERRK